MLSCVLLRREVSSVVGVTVSGGSGQGTNGGAVGEEIGRMRGMAGHLVEAFFRKGDGDGSVRRQIGFVVAEVCCSLTLLDCEGGGGGGGVSVEVMRGVLGRIESGVS